MASVNKVILIGNLGRDPETRYTTGGDAITNLNIATSEQWKDKSGEKQEKTEWHRVVLFGRQAEIAGEYLKKGRSVYIEGRLQTRKYTDKDGVEKYSTEIVGDRMQLLGSREGRRWRRRHRFRRRRRASGRRCIGWRRGRWRQRRRRAEALQPGRPRRRHPVLADSTSGAADLGRRPSRRRARATRRGSKAPTQPATPLSTRRAAPAIVARHSRRGSDAMRARGEGFRAIGTPSVAVDGRAWHATPADRYPQEGVRQAKPAGRTTTCAQRAALRDFARAVASTFDGTAITPPPRHTSPS